MEVGYKKLGLHHFMLFSIKGIFDRNTSVWVIAHRRVGIFFKALYAAP